MDILTLKKALADNAKSVAEYLLPNGTKEGSEWRVGSLNGEKGRSLGVHVGGTKAGVWCDFASGESGDLIDLWVQTRRVSLVDALKESADWLGIVRPEPAMEPKKSYVKPPKPKCQVPQGKVRDYLCEIRNIPGHILDAYKIGEQGSNIIFPFLLPNGDMPLAKSRLAEDGAKPKPTATNCEPILFGWQAVPPNAREIIVTEGEIDALSWAAYGFPAMSVPFGGGDKGKQNWIENEFERMERFERVYLSTDMDEQGEKAAHDIAERLGHERCFRISTPRKDANACLMEGIGKEVMAEAVRTAANLDPSGLKRPTHFADEVIHLFWPAPGAHVGYKTPYKKLDDLLAFRPGEVTIWTGASGAGKSQVLSDCTVDWVRQGSRICISSLEMRAPSTLKRMCKQTSGIERPTAKAINASLRWLEQGLLLYDVVGKVKVNELTKTFDYAHGKYGCDQFIIDSLMRLGVASDDHVGQEKAVYDLTNWAVVKKVHLHLVAHSRKGGIHGGAPETEDIKGASEIGSNTFNIISIWRNRALEDEIRALAAKEETRHLAEEKSKEKPGVILNIAKQRMGDFEGKIGLWFDQETYRYHSAYDKSMWSRQYLDRSDDPDLRVA